MSQPIEAILFDMNSTLRRRESHEPTQRAARERILALLGKKEASEAFWEELEQRYRVYTSWAQENLIQLSESEVWARWILPDSPPEQVEPVADELSLAWSQRKGRALPAQGAGETLAELKRRGYRMGVISNTLSSLDIPCSLTAYGWNGYFEAVTLSSVLKSRKPAPDLFLEAARLLNVSPAHCAYVGNRISRDVVGCKQAGYPLGIIIEGPDGPRLDEADQIIKPDAVIHSLSELLDLFLGVCVEKMT
jgi:putative hydrolase of the HAD superfamily